MWNMHFTKLIRFFSLWIIEETACIHIEATHKAKSTLLIIQSKNHNTQKQMIIIYPSIAIFSLCLGLSLCNFNHNTVYLKKQTEEHWTNKKNKESYKSMFAYTKYKIVGNKIKQKIIKRIKNSIAIDNLIIR